MKSMQLIVAVMVWSMSSFVYLALLLILFVFIYALLGMQTFGGNMTIDGYTPRLNFDTFNWAFLTSFVIMTNENWNSILYDCLWADVTPFITIPYMISWIFIGNFMLLNLFLAILLDAFSEEDEEEKE